MKIRPVAAKSFYADGWRDGQTDRRTNMTKVIVAFRKFANSPKTAVRAADLLPRT